MRARFIATPPYRVNTKTLGKATVIGYRMYEDGDLNPVLRVTERIGSQPIYGNLRGEIKGYKVTHDYEYFEWIIGLNLFTHLMLTSDELTAKPQGHPLVDFLANVLLSDVGNPKQVWSALETLIPTAEQRSKWAIIHLFGGGYLVKDLRTGRILSGSRLLGWVNSKAK